MRVEAGSYVATASDGTTMNVDRPLSIEQADLLFAVIQRAGQTVETTIAIEVTEGETVIEWYYEPELERLGEVVIHRTVHTAGGWWSTAELA